MHYILARHHSMALLSQFELLTEAFRARRFISNSLLLQLRDLVMVEGRQLLIFYSLLAHICPHTIDIN